MDKFITYIGPDFGGRRKWCRGAITKSGIIYCPPVYSRRRGILKVDTNTDNVTELDRNLIPEQGDGMWETCADALDGCIYFMPLFARRIMKLDPNNNDTMVSIGYFLVQFCISTVVGIDGCVYGITPELNHDLNYIVKYNPTKESLLFLEGKLLKIWSSEEMVFWEEMGVFMQQLIMVEY